MHESTSRAAGGPLIMNEETLRFRRLLERFGSRTQRAGHLHHPGTIRTTAGQDGASVHELSCACGVILGPWPDR